MLWLPDGEKFLKICLFVLTECTNVTDRWTYRHCMTAKAVLNASIASKNLMEINKLHMKYILTTLTDTLSFHLLSTQHRQLSNVRHDSTLCRTRQLGAAAELMRRRQFSGLVATPVLLQTALHSAVHLALIAEQTLFGHEHRLSRP